MKTFKKLTLILFCITFSSLKLISGPPIFDTIGDNREMNSALFVYEGNAFSFNINATDPDGDPLTYWMENTGMPSWIHFDSISHILQGTAPLWSDIDSIRAFQPGIFDVEIYVSDGVYTVSRIFTIHVLDSLWETKTIKELVAERPVEASNSTIGTPVQINILNNEIINSSYGGGKQIQKVTFSFKSQTPTLDSLQDDWITDTNFAYLPINTPAAQNAGALVEGCYSENFGKDTLGEKTCAELDIPVLVIDEGWYWDYPVELMDKYQGIAFDTRDPHYLYYVFTSAHFMRSIDALITVIDSLTNWQVSYTDFKAILTGHSKFGHTCFVAAALDDRVVGVVASGASILESGGARLLGITQGAHGTKPDAFYDYKGLMMRYYVESLQIEPQMDSSVFIMDILGTDDDKNRSTDYTPKYVLLESTNHLTHEYKTGCIPNAPHTTQTSFHEKYWKMTIAHLLLSRNLTTIDSAYYINYNGTLTVYAVVSGNPAIQSVKVWYSSQSDMDTTSWNGFSPANMTLDNGKYKADIPQNSKTFFVMVSDEDSGVEGVITTRPTPVNRNYPKLLLPPDNVEGLNVEQNGYNINVSWTNPLNTDFVNTMITYSTSNYPQTPTQGTVIYDGNGEQYTHTISDTSQTYYYTIFCYDSVGDYSTGINFNSEGNVSKQEIINDKEINLLVYPNPFSEKINILYNSKKDAYTEVNIYDISGKKVQTIFSGNLQKGKHAFIWNITNKNKEISKVYFCSIKTKNQKIIEKIIIQ